MEETRLCELIRAMRDSKWNIYKMYSKEGDNESACKSIYEEMTLNEVLHILTDNAFAERLAEIYNV
jgi:hypothetical protein